MERIIRIDGFSNKEMKEPNKKGETTFPCFECLVDNEKTFIGVFEGEVKGELLHHIGEWVKVIAPQRPNSNYINITHFVALAKPEEIPNYSENAKASDAVSIDDQVLNKQQEALEAPAPAGLAVLAGTATRVIHELIDNRIVYNKYEFGKAEDRHTIKYIKGDGQDFENQYRDIIKRRQVVDAELNPKQ